MDTVLVVDDSAVDRCLVGGLLERDAELEVQYAANGVEALGKIARDPPALVVTDLMMPEMDGLELVAAVRKGHPLVPVICMTSHGSEAIAVEALKRGAASYVPKRLLAKDLLETVRNVLSVSSQQFNRERLLGFLTHEVCEFLISNDRKLIPPLVGLLQDKVTQMEVCNPQERVRVGVALEEALVNAVYHGNLEVSSELRETDYDAYYELIAERVLQSAYRDRRVHVRAELTRTQATFMVRDEGPGFDPRQLPDPADPANLEKATGRGILLMRTFMDEVMYSEQGNEVTMIKRRESSAAAAC